MAMRILSPPLYYLWFNYAGVKEIEESGGGINKTRCPSGNFRLIASSVYYPRRATSSSAGNVSAFNTSFLEARIAQPWTFQKRELK
jgi:hypothetical protein